MKKHVLKYRFFRYRGGVLIAKRDVPFDIKITSRMLLDELCFEWNKQFIVDRINESIDKKDEKAFIKYSELYKNFI